MLQKIKKELIGNPEKLISFLESFGFCKFKIHPNYLSFARDEYSSPKSIVIYFDNNDYLSVKDYARGTKTDIFRFIIDLRGVSFREVVNEARKQTGISYEYYDKPVIFGGFYDRIKVSYDEDELDELDESVLKEYSPFGNKRFIKDGIDLNTQRFYGIGYDVESQAITIPIRDEMGRLVGVKARANDDERMSKYFYLHPVLITKTLYSYSENYAYMQNDLVVIFESEKSCMQCHSFGFNNAVAMGSSELSDKQIRMIVGLNPRKVILAHDKSSDRKAIKNNLKKILQYRKYKSFALGYVDMERDKEVPEKASPSDMGKDKFYEVLEKEIVWFKEKNDDCTESR